MFVKVIYEVKGKELLNKYLIDEVVKNRFVVVIEIVNWDILIVDYFWFFIEVRFICLFVFFFKFRYYKYFLIK